jgi:hypothetical protein
VFSGAANFIGRGLPGEGNILLFNNGRAMDRLWSTVDELVLPEALAGGPCRLGGAGAVGLTILQERR